MSRGIGRAKVSLKVLEELLPWPEGAKILAIYPIDRCNHLVYDFVISHPSIPELKVGEKVKEMQVIFEQDQNGKIIKSEFKPI